MLYPIELQGLLSSLWPGQMLYSASTQVYASEENNTTHIGPVKAESLARCSRLLSFLCLLKLRIGVRCPDPPSVSIKLALSVRVKLHNVFFMVFL